MATAFLLSVLLSTAPPPPPPPPPGGSPCTPVAGQAANAVAYFRGRYRVLGVSGKEPYTGTVVVDGAEGAGVVSVSGVVRGANVRGTGRRVLCGADKVPRLEVVLGSGKGTQTWFCVLHTDFDNFNRASCSRRLSDPNGDIELWHEWYTR